MRVLVLGRRLLAFTRPKKKDDDKSDARDEGGGESGEMILRYKSNQDLVKKFRNFIKPLECIGFGRLLLGLLQEFWAITIFQTLAP